MKKLLLSLVMLTALFAFVVTQAEAATADIGVTVTVTASALDISVSPTYWVIGELAESGTATTTDPYMVTNNASNATVDFSIESGDSTDWIAGGTAGSEVFVMEAELQGGSLTAIDTSQTLALDVAPAGTHAFDLGFRAPSSTEHAGVQQLITVTISSAIAS